MVDLDTTSLRPVKPQPTSTPVPPARLDLSTLRPAAAPRPAEPVDNPLGQVIPAALALPQDTLASTLDAMDVGRRMGMPDPMGQVIAGTIGSMVRPILPDDWKKYVPESQGTGEAIYKGASALGVNPNDYFEQPDTPLERITRLGVQGGLSSFLPGGQAKGWARLVEIAKEIGLGTAGGITAGTAMEVAPEPLKPLAGLVGGVAGYTIPSAIGSTAAGAARRAGDYMRPAFHTPANVERMAGERLAAAASNPEEAAFAMEAAPELVPGSAPTAGQASGDVGLLSMERAMARGDDTFKKMMLERVGEQNAARVAALEAVEQSGDIGAAAQFFRDRMRTLQEQADALYTRAESEAKGQSIALGERTAGDIGDQARDAMAGKLRDLNAEAGALWKSIDPDGTMHISEGPLKTVAASIYGNMSPEEMLSLSPSEKALAGIIGNYDGPIPFRRFADLRSEISRAMREAKSFANPNNNAYRRLSMLRDAIEKAVQESVIGKFSKDASLADQFVRQAKEWYAARTATPEAGAGPAAGAVPRAQQGPPDVAGASGTVGAPRQQPPPAPRDQGLPKDVRPEPRATIGEELTRPPTAESVPREAVDEQVVQQIDPRTVGVDARRFQFKEGGDEQGVTDRLQGVEKWDARLAGTTLVFRDAAGKDWIADGHQRVGLAKRLMAAGHPPIRMNAFVLDAASGITDADARAIAAIKNIAEGTGSPIDAAKVMRAAKETGIDLPPLPPRSALVRDGKALAELSPEAFGMVVNEVIPHQYGAIVGRLIKDAPVQEEALRVLAALKPDNVRQAEMVVRDILASGTELSTRQGGLFGPESFASSVTLERAKIADQALKQLRTDKALFAKLVDEADRIESAGNTLARTSNEERLSTDEKAADLLNRLAFRAGPVSSELTRLARALKAGDTSPNAAARDFLGAVRGAIARGLDEGADAGGAGVGDEAAGVAPRDPDTAEMFQSGKKPPLWREGDMLGDLETERGQEGFGQALVPGVKPITDADRMAAQARKPLAGGNAPPPKGGLFDVEGREDAAAQGSLFQGENVPEITDTIADRVVAAGRSPEEARAAGVMVDSFYTTMAERLGKSVEDLVKRFPLPQFRRGGDQGEMFQPAPPVRSAAFERWFRDSKVVDAKGEPMVMYHSTSAPDFEKFRRRTGDIGMHFGTVGQAEDRANFMRGRARAEDAGPREGERMIPVYLSIKRPLRLKDAGAWNADNLEYQLRDAFPSDIERIRRLKSTKDIREFIRSKGYDGIVYKNTGEANDAARMATLRAEQSDARDALMAAQKARGRPLNGFDKQDQATPEYQRYSAAERAAREFREGEGSADSYIAFEPTQIKSVYNRGTFDPNDPRILFQPAYHGTPHIFDKFDSSKIGTGEGAQAYGHGLYFAGKKEVAQWYREQLTNDAVEPAKRALAKSGGDVDAAINAAVAEIDRLKALDLKPETGAATRDRKVADQEDRIRQLTTFKETGEWKAGRLFAADIPGDDELMNWDAPLSEQPPKVQEAARTLLQARADDLKKSMGVESNIDKDMADLTGEDLYGETSVRLGSDAAASKAFRDLGIPGHRYIGHESGSTNYVIYDDSRINVTGFEQRGPNNPRGSINFGDTGSLISLFERADPSTIQHELGHHYLSMFKSVAEGADAPEAMLADWRATKAWWQKNSDAVAKDAGQGVTGADVRKVLAEGTTGDRMKDLAINVGFHEQWARAFETYLREGKAPNSKLKAIFEQFKNWLMSIYRNASDLGISMTPEIRAVFDRMLGAEGKSGVRMMDQAAAERFAAATKATREMKDTFGAKPVKQILRRPGATYPYDMPSENVAAQIFRAGPEGSAAIKAAVRAGAPREAIEAAAVLSLKRAAEKDGSIDPSKFEAWRQKHADALAQVPGVGGRMSSAAAATKAMADLGERIANAKKEIERSAIGRVLRVQDDADIAATISGMLGKRDSVKAMRELADQARRSPDAMAGLQSAVFSHMLRRLKTPKDALASFSFQKYLGQNMPALKQVLEPHQITLLRNVAADLKRATKDVTAPGGGSNTAENLAARAKYLPAEPTLLGQIIRNAIGSGTIGWLTHAFHGPVAGAISGVSSFLGGAVIQAMRQRGIHKVDDLLREALMDPALAAALIAKAPKRPGAGSAATLARRLRQIAMTALLSAAAAREREERERQKKAA